MTIAVAYKSHQFRFVTDESELRNSDKYQLIRDEINRLNSPSYGKIDWEKIKRLCEELACTDGLSFLTTIYYTAALVKINGTSGLADGLELQFAVLKLLFEKNKDSLIKCAELYRWMIARIGDDLRRLDPNKSQIKDSLSLRKML
ncbi:type VI secretion system ImpA family N-terminal domain-containing protein [Photobacterium leiognathi]|uniref:type VI secretion system ImpA family N-terminal domain-containing protein n=1 Tax=Photobacterium leiognathi TaxID=553611 RepID=UPI003DA16CB5